MARLTVSPEKPGLFADREQPSRDEFRHRGSAVILAARDVTRSFQAVAQK